MKRFIKTLTSFFVVVLVVCIFINKLYVSKLDIDEDWCKFRNVPSDIGICNLGSSHGGLSGTERKERRGLSPGGNHG